MTIAIYDVYFIIIFFINLCLYNLSIHSCKEGFGYLEDIQIRTFIYTIIRFVFK